MLLHKAKSKRVHRMFAWCPFPYPELLFAHNLQHMTPYDLHSLIFQFLL